METRKNLTVDDFHGIYNNTWHINNSCPECGKILTEPLKLFTDCFVGLGIRGNPDLMKACKEYREIEQKLWGLINDIEFEFIDEE
jgi:hypothetical protein